MSRVSRIFVAIALLVTAPASLQAQTDAGSRALAVQLFDEAEALIAKGDAAAACPKYAESYRLDPQLGALIHVADCYERVGRLASAWGAFREAEELATKRGDSRASSVQQRAAALEPRLSRLVIEVPVEGRLSGLTVLRDGARVESVVWGTAAAIDAGRHEIEARAPGYEPWKTEVTISQEGSVANVTVPKLLPAPGSSQRPEDSATAPKATPGSSRRIAAIAVGGLGLAAVGVGGFFGLSAQSSFSDSNDLCSERNVCTQRGADLRSSAKSKALVATVATSVGAGALIAAGVLWFTAPRAEQQPSTAGRRRAETWAIVPTTDAWGLEARHAF